MPNAQLIGALWALGAALCYGAGDFSGGFASRRQTATHVVVIYGVSGSLLAGVLALIFHEPWPNPETLLISLLAALAAVGALILLFDGIASGHAAIVAPVSTLVGAVLPVLVGIITEGLPDEVKLIGFAVALLSIWLVSASPAGDRSRERTAVLMGLGSGVCFGAYLALMAQVQEGSIQIPMLVTRGSMGIVGLIVLGVRRLPAPRLLRNPVPIAAGLLNTTASVLYMMAEQLVRLDVAAALTSMSPGVTVLLAWLVLHEPVSRRQIVGVALSLVAIALIVL